MTVCSVPAQTLQDAGAAANHSKPSEAVDPASMQAMQIPSHDKLMNGFVYVAAGPGPHPAVILLHGYPGNERNLDLAQDMRRAGWDVLYFDYRGSWGTPGDFSFSHSIEDTAAALAYLRKPDVAKSLRLDPKRIVLIGHSMGGFMAVQAAAADRGIKAFALISAVDMDGDMQIFLGKEDRLAVVAATAAVLADGIAPLAGCTPRGLADELVHNVASWQFAEKVDSLKNRTALIITSDDGYAPENNRFAVALFKAGDGHVTVAHLSSDHAYSNQRIELSSAVLHWLATLPK